MNIHKIIPFVQAIKEEEILHLGNWYLRKEFSDGTFVWKTMHGEGYAIETPDKLEKEYQKLLNKPVQTTNEQLELCECEGHLKKDCKYFCGEPS